MEVRDEGLHLRIVEDLRRVKVDRLIDEQEW